MRPAATTAPQQHDRFRAAYHDETIRQIKRFSDKYGRFMLCDHDGYYGTEGEDAKRFLETASYQPYAALMDYFGYTIEEIPTFSKQRYDEAVEFWLSWYNPNDGHYYNPLLTDPRNPDERFTGYNRAHWVNEKYLHSIYGLLGVNPPGPDFSNNPDAVDFDWTRHYYEQLHNDAGNHVGAQIMRYVDKIDKGMDRFIPYSESEASHYLSLTSPEDGCIRTGYPWSYYSAVASSFKFYRRIIAYIGTENVDLRGAADHIIEFAGDIAKRPGDPGHKRNSIEFALICTWNSEYRKDELYNAIETIAGGLARDPEAAAHDHITAGYTLFGLTLAGMFLNWEGWPKIVPVASACMNEGMGYAHGFTLGPFGKWFNVIEKPPEERTDHPDFSYAEQNLAARNRSRSARSIHDVVTWREMPDFWRTTTARPADDRWMQPGYDDSGWDSKVLNQIAGAADGTDTVYMRKEFSLPDGHLKDPYIKARWRGGFELFINGVRAKRILYNPEARELGWCGLALNREARAALRSGKNTIAATFTDFDDRNTYLDVALVDWR